MSRRRSAGELVPKDITEVLAREARVQRGHRKPGSSLGQAFSWLKGSKRKKSLANGLNQSAVGVKDGKDNAHDSAKAGPKASEEQKRLAVHYTAARHYQENVFIEGSRPQYLEDLHTEALEGLKILQEDQQEQDISPKVEDGRPESGSPSGNSDTSVFSAGSTRPGLTRQGSTFKPLNPVKSIDRNKKRGRRTTIMGIPNQVQKELALRRHSTFQQLPESNGASNGQSGALVIPTVDGGVPAANRGGARVHLSELEVRYSPGVAVVSKEEKLLHNHLQAVYQDEQHFSFQGFGHLPGPTSTPGPTSITSTLRPKSVAVPGMTSFVSCPSTVLSFLQEPQGPVMSISPQATYMSTIIPNAVLPAAVDVIEIDHGLSRARGSSVHTVSKSSLGSGDSPVSPVLSRRSDVDGSQNDTSLNSSSFACDSASESQSSKTIVLISSPASSKRSTCSVDSQSLSVSEHRTQQDQTGEDLVSIHSSVSVISCPTSTSEHLVAGDASEMDTSQVEDKKLKRRSLSVTKTKQPPAPPRRTNSLHCNKIRNNAKVLVNCQEPVLENDVTVTTTVTLSTPGSVIENGGAHPKSDASFSNRDKMERTISPSSGYSSQSGTPTLSPKEFSPTSPEKQKKASVKPETSVSPSSPSSSLTSLSSGASEPANHDVPSKDSSAPPTVVSSALSTQIKSLINVPAHPKVRAPCPPPPELSTQPADEEPTTSESCDADTNLKQNGRQATDKLTIEVPKLSKNTPPATPPPTYHPTPPLTRKPTISTQDSVELQKVQEDGKVSESCWPPPPPPLEEAYEGGDETEFPLPPPPPPLPVENSTDVPDKADKNNVTVLIKNGQTVQAKTLPKPEDLLHIAHPNQTAENPPSSVSFRRQPSTANRAKEFHARHKSVPIPKEDANIPLVTPSLLQMVRLRSVSMAEGDGNGASEEKSANVETSAQESRPVASQTPQNTPQKPIRKSLSVKSSSPLPSPTVVQPSLRLQEAIRMKTAAMSSKESLLVRPVARLPPYNTKGVPGSDTHKSTASTASFIFARSDKKVVIETVEPSPEAQMSLKQNLAAELVHLSEQSKSNAYSNGGIKSVPPPVARKPS
ncbi:hypothetical protein NQD34_008301, partial [Periophthalmus magnuspinnatus]